MSDWTKFATSHYRKTLKTNPDYKFKNALVDAGKLYKKGGEVNTLKKKGTMSKKRSNKKGSRKNRK